MRYICGGPYTVVEIIIFANNHWNQLYEQEHAYFSIDCVAHYNIHSLASARHSMANAYPHEVRSATQTTPPLRARKTDNHPDDVQLLRAVTRKGCVVWRYYDIIRIIVSSLTLIVGMECVLRLKTIRATEVRAVLYTQLWHRTERTKTKIGLCDAVQAHCTHKNIYYFEIWFSIFIILIVVHSHSIITHIFCLFICVPFRQPFRHRCRFVQKLSRASSNIGVVVYGIHGDKSSHVPGTEKQTNEDCGRRKCNEPHWTKVNGEWITEWNTRTQSDGWGGTLS